MVVGWGARKSWWVMVGSSVLLCLSSCTALNHPSDDDIRCVIRSDGTDPCLQILRVCREGRCVLPDIDSGTL